MKFYNREHELGLLQEMFDIKTTTFTCILGRRRIGKTELLRQFSQHKSSLYFFVSKKTEGNVLRDFESVLLDVFRISLQFSSLKDFFTYLFTVVAKEPNIIIIFDEFQNFEFINKTVLYDIQNLWDAYKMEREGTAKIFALGSLYTLMHIIFSDYGQPLYRRQTHRLHLHEFDVFTMKQILSDYDQYTPHNLLILYGILGGVPAYLGAIETMSTKLPFKEALISHSIQHFDREGYDILQEEFGNGRKMYFSILEAIACGYTTRNRISDYTQISYDSLGIYLQKLEETYLYITKIKPIGKTKYQKFVIKDRFLRFWFRYIFKKQSLLQAHNYQALQRHISNDIQTFLGTSFEQMVKEMIYLLNDKGEYTINIQEDGVYRDRFGKNEIDLIFWNKKEVVFVECKINKERFTPKEKKLLIQKSEHISYFKYHKKLYEYRSLNDIQKYL